VDIPTPKEFNNLAKEEEGDATSIPIVDTPRRSVKIWPAKAGNIPRSCLARMVVVKRWTLESQRLQKATKEETNTTISTIDTPQEIEKIWPSAVEDQMKLCRVLTRKGQCSPRGSKNSCWK
jgi:hypothetical protein